MGHLQFLQLVHYSGLIAKLSIHGFECLQMLSPWLEDLKGPPRCYWKCLRFPRWPGGSIHTVSHCSTEQSPCGFHYLCNLVSECVSWNGSSWIYVPFLFMIFFSKWCKRLCKLEIAKCIPIQGVW